MGTREKKSGHIKYTETKIKHENANMKTGHRQSKNEGTQSWHAMHSTPVNKRSLRVLILHCVALLNFAL